MIREEIIKKYFPLLNDVQAGRFRRLGDLYPEWNEKINVISRKDIDNLYVHHILHSLAIARFITPVAGTEFLDMGTGGGFPGIPLAIMFPDCRFHLIDRIGKKIKVAQSVADAIGLDNVTFQHGDIGECRQKYDYLVSRAVMRLDELMPLVNKNISRKQRNAVPNGLICLKGGDLADEIRKTRGGEPMVDDLSSYFDEPFFETKKLIYVPVG
ncbi:MAG: 16S rRNA (guanine(527)-N(7))-methyltransferase RsmG [Muribaculaceae bacterium]|nr:16S rRNA (guanine(527)-N(7))-methyltransferase RsmG [Muribaculaceae bacterium]